MTAHLPKTISLIDVSANIIDLLAFLENEFVNRTQHPYPDELVIKQLSALTAKQTEFVFKQVFKDKHLKYIAPVAQYLDSLINNLPEFQQKIWRKTLEEYLLSKLPDIFKNDLNKNEQEKYKLAQEFLHFEKLIYDYLKAAENLYYINHWQSNGQNIFDLDCYYQISGVDITETPSSQNEKFIKIIDSPFTKTISVSRGMSYLAFYELAFAISTRINATTPFIVYFKKHLSKIELDSNLMITRILQNRMAEETTILWLGKVIKKNMLMEILSAFAKTEKILEKLPEANLSKVFSALSIRLIPEVIEKMPAAIAVKYIFLLGEQNLTNLNMDQIRRIDSEMPTDHEKIMFYLLFCIRSSEAAFYNIQDAKKIDQIISFVIQRLKTIRKGVVNELKDILHDQKNDIDSLISIIPFLTQYFNDGYKNYNYLLFKSYQNAFTPEEKKSLLKNILATKKEILSGVLVSQMTNQENIPLLAAATVEAIPLQSRHLGPQEAENLIFKSHGDDLFLREPLMQLLPQITNPDNLMSFEIKKSITKVEKVKAREYLTPHLKKFLALNNKKITFAKILKSKNFADLQGNLFGFMINEDRSLLSNYANALDQTPYLGLQLINDYINDAALEKIMNKASVYQNSQSEKLILQYLSALKNIIPGKGQDFKSLKQFFRETHSMLWNEILCELKHALESFSDKILIEEKINYQIGKNAFLAICGGLADVCIAKDYALFKRSDFNVLSMKNNEQYLGFTMLYFTEYENKKMLVIGGIEPAPEISQNYKPEQIYRQTIEVMLEYLQKTDISYLALLNVSDISNRQNLNQYLIKEVLPRLVLKPFETALQRTHNSFYHDFYLLWEKSNN